MSTDKITVVFATTNKGKLAEVRGFVEHLGVPLEVIGLNEIATTQWPEVEETGTTLGENAKLKVEFARPCIVSNYVVIADDTGFSIDALDGEPGIYVRRWRDHVTELTDEEIIACCLERMNNVPAGPQRGAHTESAIAIAYGNGDVEIVTGRLEGEVVVEPGPYTPGMPLEGLFYVTEWEQLLGAHRATGTEQFERETHRTRAMRAAVEAILAHEGKS